MLHCLGSTIKQHLHVRFSEIGYAVLCFALLVLHRFHIPLLAGDRCAFCVHPTTGQLIAVDQSGRLIVYIEQVLFIYFFVFWFFAIESIGFFVQDDSVPSYKSQPISPGGPASVVPSVPPTSGAPSSFLSTSPASHFPPSMEKEHAKAVVQCTLGFPGPFRFVSWLSFFLQHFSHFSLCICDAGRESRKYAWSGEGTILAFRHYIAVLTDNSMANPPLSNATSASSSGPPTSSSLSAINGKDKPSTSPPRRDEKERNGSDHDAFFLHDLRRRVCGLVCFWCARVFCF